MIDVSVIIPVYNASALINRCLDSVFNQIGDFKVEVILVDDGSTDNSVEIIKLRSEQDKIRLFMQENSGPAKARNRGIQEARGKYLAFLDADDYWLPEFVITTKQFLDKHEDCVAVSVAQRHLTTTGEHESPRGWKSLAQKNGIIINDFFEFWSEYNHICTGSIMIRSKVAKESKGMREDLRICEDLEYWAYLSTFGKFGYIPKLLFVSDGAKVTEKIGWKKKNLPRWKSAMPVENWMSRIVVKSKGILHDQGFIRAIGRIAQNLTYSILLSKRYELAREQVYKYGKHFPSNKMRMLLLLAASNHITWLVISRFLVYREYNRR